MNRDWNDAYANTIHIAGGSAYPDTWSREAKAFRLNMSAAGRLCTDLVYGPHPRNTYDLFRPEGTPRGLVVFVHGGYWMSFDKSSWSHLASGALAHGFAVAMPSYILCPEVPIASITRQIGAAITAAASEISGPLHLAGHSAGGHLVTRMMSTTSPLAPAILARLRKVVAISGLHDLRPLMRTDMNETLQLDAAQAAAESPALLHPHPDVALACWVGAAERPEFVRQNALLANIWTGLGASALCVEEPQKHHYNVLEGLSDPDHPLTGALVAET